MQNKFYTGISTKEHALPAELQTEDHICEVFNNYQDGKISIKIRGPVQNE